MYRNLAKYWLMVAILCCGGISPCFAQNQSAGEANGNVTPDETVYLAQPEDTSVFKFAWEMKAYEEEYPIATHSLWSEPNYIIEAYGLATLSRNEQDEDSKDISGYLSVRPFVLDFDDFSIAFGGSFTGALLEFENADVVVDNDQGSIFADGIDGNANFWGVSLSTLTSIPKWGVQIAFEAGFTRSNFRVRSDRVVVEDEVDVGGGLILPAELIYEDYQYKQHDNYFTLSFEIQKFFDRQFFNFISLSGAMGLHLDNRFRSSRADFTVDINNGAFVQNFGRVDLDDPALEAELDAQVDLAEGETFETDLFAAALNIRIVEIPVELPFLKDRGISIHSLAGIEHSTDQIFDAENHGYGLSLGAQISLWDAVSVSYVYNWQNENDLQDEGAIIIAIGLYGGTDFNKIITNTVRQQRFFQ